MQSQGENEDIVLESQQLSVGQSQLLQLHGVNNPINIII